MYAYLKDHARHSNHHPTDEDGARTSTSRWLDMVRFPFGLLSLFPKNLSLIKIVDLIFDKAPILGM